MYVKAKIKNENLSFKFIALVIIISIAIATFPIISLYYLIKSILNCIRIKNIKPSNMQCPNCKKLEIKIQESNKRRFLTLNSKREGICQKCGFNYEYYTDNDIREIKIKTIFNIILSVILTIVSLTIAFNYFYPTETDTDNGIIFASTYTDIEDFDYYLDGNTVYLKNYSGESKKVKINNKYKIKKGGF